MNDLGRAVQSAPTQEDGDQAEHESRRYHTDFRDFPVGDAGDGEFLRIGIVTGDVARAAKGELEAAELISV